MVLKYRYYDGEFIGNFDERVREVDNEATELAKKQCQLVEEVISVFHEIYFEAEVAQIALKMNDGDCDCGKVDGALERIKEKVNQALSGDK